MYWARTGIILRKKKPQGLRGQPAPKKAVGAREKANGREEHGGTGSGFEKRGGSQ